MHYNPYFIYSIFAVAFAGAISYWRKFEEIKEQRSLAYEYQNKFIGLADYYAQSSRLNDDYTWLVQNAFIVQRRMGSMGRMHVRQPFENKYIPNYEIIVNALSKFRSGIVHEAEIGYADDALLRYLKHMDELFEQAEKNLKNPFLWLRQGFRYIVALPVYLLDWFGLLSNSAAKRIVNNSSFQFLSNLTAFVTFVSSVVTIVVGYDQTIAFIKRFLAH
jgi:hypothetical protein